MKRVAAIRFLGLQWSHRAVLVLSNALGATGCNGLEVGASTDALPIVDDDAADGSRRRWPLILAPMGPDCLALARAAVQAIPCEPTLANVVGGLVRRPNEGDCREAARALLETSQVLEGEEGPTAPSPGSLVGIDPAVRTRPLSPDELDSLRVLPLPGLVRVTPDAAPAPGVPAVEVWLDGARASGDETGLVQRRLAPGSHELTLFHAGQRSTSCLTLERCVTVELVAQGHLPSRHPAIQRAACR